VELEPKVMDSAAKCKIEQDKIAIDKDHADVKGKEVAGEKAIADSEKAKVEVKAEKID